MVCPLRNSSVHRSLVMPASADPAKEEIRAGLEGSACGGGREQLSTHGTQLSIV